MGVSKIRGSAGSYCKDTHKEDPQCIETAIWATVTSMGSRARSSKDMGFCMGTLLTNYENPCERSMSFVGALRKILIGAHIFLGGPKLGGRDQVTKRRRLRDGSRTPSA